MTGFSLKKILLSVLAIVFIVFLALVTGAMWLFWPDSTSSDFDPISRHIYIMDFNEVDLQPRFFPNLQERNSVLTKLQVNGYSNVDCQADTFDECFVRNYDKDSKTFEFLIKLSFEYNDLTTANNDLRAAIGRFKVTRIRNAKNK